jgi:hypothetical protein
LVSWWISLFFTDLVQLLEAEHVYGGLLRVEDLGHGAVPPVVRSALAGLWFYREVFPTKQPSEAGGASRIS